MELLEYHFANITGNLYYDENTKTFEMFSNKGIPKHLNYLTFRELFKNMLNLKEPTIIETGISSAGTQSTYLFNEYIKKYGGRFYSVDTNQNLVNMHQGNMCPATTLVCNDSVKFLNDWVKYSNDKQVDVVYLDSYDLDWYDYKDSGIHGLKEYTSLLPVLKKGSLLLIDDTPSTPYWLDSRGKLYDDMVEFYNKNHYLPGKGMYILDVNNRADILMHNYQVLYKFT